MKKHSPAPWTYNDMESTGYSFFGDVTWSVNEQLDITLGARWTYDEKDMRTRVAKSGGALGNDIVFPQAVLWLPGLM